MKSVNNIGVIDCGIGNIGSLTNALSHLGKNFSIVTCADELQKTSAAMLPGVGAFDSAVQKIRENQLDQAILEYVRTGKNLLGICVGMQILFLSSEEGTKTGLGLLPAHVRSLGSLNTKGKVPHVGFNEIRAYGTDNQFLKNMDRTDFYFTHSYAAEIKDEQISHAISYHEGATFASAVAKDNIFGVQFHPEKSGLVGLELIRDFCEC